MSSFERPAPSTLSALIVKWLPSSASAIVARPDFAIDRPLDASAEFLADALVQQVQQVGAGGLVAGCEFARGGRAADPVRRFQNGDFFARLCQVGCAYEAVVATANDHYLI